MGAELTDRAVLFLATRGTARAIAVAALIFTGGALPASARRHHDEHQQRLKAEG